MQRLGHRFGSCTFKNVPAVFISIVQVCHWACGIFRVSKPTVSNVALLIRRLHDTAAYPCTYTPRRHELDALKALLKWRWISELQTASAAAASGHGKYWKYTKQYMVTWRNRIRRSTLRCPADPGASFVWHAVVASSGVCQLHSVLLLALARATTCMHPRT